MSGNSSRPTLLSGDPHERGVTGFVRRARQKEAARHSETQRSSTLHQVRTRFDDQASVQSSWRVSSDDDDDEYHGVVGHPVDWTVVCRVDGKFTRAARSSAGTSEHARHSHVDDEPPRAGAHNPLE